LIEKKLLFDGEICERKKSAKAGWRFHPGEGRKIGRLKKVKDWLKKYTR
jgi:hypothetical protein